MRMLFGPAITATRRPGAELDDEDVRELYPWPPWAADRPDRRWVRAMMVTTLDGAAKGPDGVSKSITGDADQQVFNGVRRFADAVLVGAGTVRAEGYGPMRARPEDVGQRALDHQRDAAVLAIVSGSLDLEWDGEIFAKSTETPIVLTGSGADPDRVAAGRQHAEVVVLDEERVSATAAIAALEERGLRRIVCEGGPTLLESVVAEGLLDEADITLAPSFAGIGGGPDAGPLQEVVGLELVHVLTGDGYLMNRYVRRRPAADPSDASEDAS